MKNLTRNRQTLLSLLFFAALLMLAGCDFGTYSSRASEGVKTYKPAKPPSAEEMESMDKEVMESKGEKAMKSGDKKAMKPKDKAMKPKVKKMEDSK